MAYNKTHYFFDGPQQRGLTYEAGKGFEEFLNERLGSKEIRVNGRETVQYVSNIYKYYVTYNLVSASGAARPSPGQAGG